MQYHMAAGVRATGRGGAGRDGNGWRFACGLSALTATLLHASAAGVGAHSVHGPHIPQAKPAELAMVLARLSALEARFRQAEEQPPRATRSSLPETFGSTIEPAAGHPDIPGLEIHVGPRIDLDAPLPVVIFDGPAPARPGIAFAETILSRAETRADGAIDLPLLAGLIKTWEGMGDVAMAMAEHEEARIAYRRVLRQFERLPPRTALSAELTEARMRALEHWGDLSFRLADYADANLAYEELAEHRYAGATHGGEGQAGWQRLARTMIKLSAARAWLDDMPASRSALEAARRMTERMIADAGTSARDRQAMEKQLQFIETRMAALVDVQLLVAKGES